MTRIPKSEYARRRKALMAELADAAMTRLPQVLRNVRVAERGLDVSAVIAPAGVGPGKRGHAARTPPRGQVAAVPQVRVGAGHRGPADAQRSGQLALAGQAGAAGDATVDDQVAQGFSQAGVGG